jgi:spore germination protein KB
MEKGVITNSQLMMLITVITLSTSILYVPQPITSSAGRDGWFLVLVAGGIGIFNTLIFIWIARLYPGKNLIQINRLLLGKVLGFILNCIYIFYFIDLGTWVLREFSAFLLITFIPITPIIVYLILGMIMCSYATFHGVEVLARINEIIFFLVIFILLVIYLFLFGQYHLEYVKPILENGFIHPLKHILTPAVWFGDVMIISMLINHVKQNKNTTHFILGGIGITFFFILLDVLVCTLVFGAETTATLTYPTFSLIQNISIANIIDRFDVIVVALWVAGTFVKFTSYFLAAVQGFSDMISLENYRYLIFPLSIGWIIYARFKVAGGVEMARLFSEQAWFWSMFQFVIPLLLLCIAFTKQMLWKKGNEES